MASYRPENRNPFAEETTAARVTLLLGGARSGKSDFAESLAAGVPRPVYLATAEAGDEEMAERIRRHRTGRGPRWETIEEPLDLTGALSRCAASDSIVVVDCLTLWLSNLMGAGREVGEEIDSLLTSVERLAGPVIFVSNEVGLGIVPDNAMARGFRDHAGRLHAAIAARADTFYLLVAGVPLFVKGTLDSATRLRHGGEASGMNPPNEIGIVTEPDGGRAERFPLPADEKFLFECLEHVFENYWDCITFGPMIQGAAFEMRCSEPPSRMGIHDGYMTVHFGETHFHLCLGETRGSRSAPTPAAVARHRRVARAEFFRMLDREDAPVSWGMRLFNGAGEQQITIWFPNPFIGDDDKIVARPDWSRLVTWEALTARYLGREADPRDRSAKEFHHG